MRGKLQNIIHLTTMIRHCNQLLYCFIALAATKNKPKARGVPIPNFVLPLRSPDSIRRHQKVKSEQTI